MSLKKQLLWNLAPIVVISAVNLFSVPLNFRFLGAELYGIWLWVLSLNGTFGFADLGLGVIVGRFVGVALGRGDQQAVREYWGTGNLIVLPFIGLIALLFTVLGVIWGPKGFNVSPSNESMLRLCFIPAGLGLF